MDTGLNILKRGVILMDSNVCQMCKDHEAKFLYILGNAEAIPVCTACYRILYEEHTDSNEPAIFIPIEDADTLLPLIKRLEKDHDKRRI